MATKIDINEVKAMSVDQIKEVVESLQKELLRLRFDHATKGIEKPVDIRQVRRDIARAKTVQRSKELEGVVLASRSKIRNRRKRR